MKIRLENAAFIYLVPVYKKHLLYFYKKHNLGRLGFPGGLDGKKSACNVGELGLIPESGRTPGEGNGNPLQSSSLGNPMDRRAWQTTVHGVAKTRHKGATSLWEISKNKEELSIITEYTYMLIRREI